MKDFKSFLEDDDLDIEELDEDELSDAMWDFIEGLDDTVIEGLDEEQLADYVEIIEAVAGRDEDDDDDDDEVDDDGEKKKKKKPTFGKKDDLDESDKDILKKNQHKDAFTLSDDEAAPLLKKKLISVNKSTRNVSGKDKAYSITDKGKGFVEAIEAIEEAMPAKRVRRDVIQKRKASREHRKVKAKRKLSGRRKRKTASFKRYKKKAKRLGKRGLTATGKRKRKFINKG